MNLLRNILGSCWSALGRALRAMKPKRRDHNLGTRTEGKP